MTDQYVLSNYPLSNSFKQWLENELDTAPQYMTVPELRQRSPYDALRFLRRLRGETLLLVLEDANSSALLPVLEIMGTLSRVKRLAIVTPDKKMIRFPRWQAASAAASFATMSLRCLSAIYRCEHELKGLVKEERVVPRRSSSKEIAYLNANLWFGVKAGGSVGHISGVVNALLKKKYAVDFFSAGSRLMVAPEAHYIQLQAPNGYGIPFDGNYYAFNVRAAARVAKDLEKRDFAFLYQRMSVANYSGVTLSRRFRIPLVLEYNGSEVWIASKWGRPLTHPRVAEKAENVCLNHAHAIVTVSDVLRDQLLARGVAAERIVSYPNCFDPEIFDPNRFSGDDLQQLRSKYGISQDAIVVGFLGTFGQWHGVEVIGEAVRVLARQNRKLLEDAKVHFLIIGDGIRMGQLKELLSDRSCQGLYTLPGLLWQEEAPMHLAATDILLSPHVRNVDDTKFFGSPTKLFEYMAMGKAIVASDLDQIGEVLENSLRSGQLPTSDPSAQSHELSVLCPPGDPQALADAMVFLFRNEKWRVRLGQNTRSEALRKYTWEHHVTAIEQRLVDLGLIEWR